ncbi:MAG: hypothetical protein NZ956_02110 [Candidatus Caldarchaeum sp.]|nr:hypothetical protein [Candidatus Caldarchaeum sp.]
MPGAYVVAEAIFVISLVITASAYASTMFNFVDEIKQANRWKLDRIRKDAVTAVEAIFGHVSENRSVVFVWLKNVGSGKISWAEVEASEVFLVGRQYLAHVSYGHGLTKWEYELVRELSDDNGWSWGETLLVKIRLASPLQPGEYVVKIAGVHSSVSYVFSVGG